MEDVDTECDVCGADPATGRPRETPLEELDPPAGFLEGEEYDDFVSEELDGEAVETKEERARGRAGCLLVSLLVLAVAALLGWLVSGGRP
jgi:hypothetical protein